MEKQAWYERYLNKDMINIGSRLLTGSAMAVSSLVGWPAIVAASLVSAGIPILINQQEIRTRERQYRDLYKNELGVLFNKSPDDVTVEDLRLAGTPVEQGGKGIIPIQKQLEFLDQRQKYTIIAELAVTGLLAAGLVALSVFAPVFMAQVPRFLIATVGGAAIGVAQNAAGKATETYLKDYFAHINVNRHLLDISRQIEQEPLKPTRVLGLFVMANPPLQAYIRETYGQDYDRLLFTKKQDVLKELEPRLPIEALTDAINKGEIKPSIIGFLAYGQKLEGSPDYEKCMALVGKTTTPAAPAASAQEPLSYQSPEYVRKLAEQRSLPDDHSRVH